MIMYPLVIDKVQTRVIDNLGLDEPVFLLHGLSSRCERWVPFMREIERRGIHAYAIELPGHGFASKGRGFDYTARGFATFLRKVIDALEPERKVHLIGTSFSGLVAGHYTMSAPRRVASLTLVGSLGLEEMSEERRNSTGKWLADMSVDAIITRRRISAARQDVFEQHDAIADSRINSSTEAQEAFAEIARYYRDGINHDVMMPGLTVLPPDIAIGMVWGEEDNTVPVEIAKRTQAALPRATLSVIAGCAHLPYFECPAGFATAWLRDVLHRS
jgi:pimeloyl-ACP methyl ester carboxylesterase